VKEIEIHMHVYDQFGDTVLYQWSAFKRIGMFKNC
jgi:hypothetical protein